jgi:internalin A
MAEKTPEQIALERINEVRQNQRKELNLVGLGLSKLPSELFQLQNLRILNLRNNNIISLPEGIKQLNSLRFLNLAGNPISIPEEILNKTFDPAAILSYYFTYGFKKPINQAKILIVGQGSVGKTSLVHRVVNNIFNPEEPKTDGIAISRWNVSNIQYKPYLSPKQLPEILLNIWDFGGQEIMHATHQFFLTKRSLYLLVLDARLTQEENRVEYWLKIIQSFGGGSPTLIVGNKVDQHPLDIDRIGLQKKYPYIVDIIETSASSGGGIEELKAAIAKQINDLPHVRDLLPETWFAIKMKLEEIGQYTNFITHDRYLDLCSKYDVAEDDSQRTLIGFMHDLGVVLHFQDDPRLEALGILNPQWVTNGVYKIINSRILFQNKGVLTVSMLDEILNLPEYPRGKRLFIVDMMKKFELCYDIEPDKTFLVPDLLPKDEPTELKFNGVPAFEYAYPVLPSSVITRFIVRMNQKIDDGLVWRTGVMLKIGENKALVKADIEDRKITIGIEGLEHTRRDALSTIRTHLDDIHNSIKGLNPEKFVPVPGADKAKPLPYNYLLMLEAKGIEILPAQDGDRLVEVNVRQVLSGVESEAQRKEQQGNIVNNYYNANNGGIIVGRDLSGNLISGNYNKINSAEIAPELKDTLLQLGEAVDTMIQKLPAEQAAEVAEDFGKLADEAVKPKPNQKWYSVSIEGLIKAAENLDKLGTPVISLSRKVLSLLTGGVVK